MPSQPIEDYALIGDCHTAALVGRNGSIDWLCLPRFDSAACFAALLGDARHGHWLVAPAVPVRKVRRRYRPGTLILETEFETSHGVVRLVDCMPIANGRSDVLRFVVGVRGRVAMRMELVMRPDYGSIVPWVRRVDGGLLATAGPDAMQLRTPLQLRGRHMRTFAEFEVGKGERIPLHLAHRPSHLPAPEPQDPERLLADTEKYWRDWSGRCTYRGPRRADVQRSLITLKALTYLPTGGIVAAATTSLPEQFGGVRNWDYRYCWLRDATFTLNALLLAGYTDEAVAWREWLLRAVAGRPADMQTLYSVTGERRLDEYELDWLPGYDGARPVRVGNAAARQLQLDIYGELMDTLHLARHAGVPPQPHAWQIQRKLLDYLERRWEEPDEGIWEIRGPRRQFTHSKVMAWVAFDRAIKSVEQFGLDGPVARWRALRSTIHGRVCRQGFNRRRNAFVQCLGGAELDASLLLLPQLGFLPPDDPRVIGTVEAVQRELTRGPLVWRYQTHTGIDNLPPGEGSFLPCSFWLVDALALIGRHAEAEALFKRVIALRNDVGLLAEEIDADSGRMLGNFPQAFSHMALVNTVRVLGLSRQRIQRSGREGERPAAAPSAAARRQGARKAAG
ncbi:glycoside hydrolase family 15 protein [Variovorax sp.]|uniref:glycoside hydrolase family 15 protein n=1 Tax=Variovorax sp. TaxID=1871043 RepID=UPI002D2E3B8B|nr:glycoside hydrolase family 15 protein [Variovorax sp.]HYP85876.1 glycoside hydrolase family 15 protein [Variovorax sp.]